MERRRDVIDFKKEIDDLKKDMEGHVKSIVQNHNATSDQVIILRGKVESLEEKISTLVSVLTAVNGTKTLFGWLWDMTKGLSIIAGGFAVVWHWIIRDLAR